MTEPWTTGVGDRWRAWRTSVDLDEYETRWDRLASEGHDVHGEADAVERLGGGRVLDAGCGMGRVAIELDRRGHTVVGLDADSDLLSRAEQRAPHIPWAHADLSRFELDEQFDVILLAGDVLTFVAPDRRTAAVQQVAAHLAPGGSTVIGGAVGGDVTVADLSRWIDDAGLTVTDRWSTWDGAPYDGDAYAVIVARASSIV